MRSEAFTGAGLLLDGLNAITTACGAAVSGVYAASALIATSGALAIGFFDANAIS